VAIPGRRFPGRRDLVTQRLLRATAGPGQVVGGEGGLALQHPQLGEKLGVRAARLRGQQLIWLAATPGCSVSPSGAARPG